MLSEYELLNLVSTQKYTRISEDERKEGSSFVRLGEMNTMQGPIHLTDEQGTEEHNYIRPSTIHNLYDLFMYLPFFLLMVRKDFQEKEAERCVGDWMGETIRWKTCERTKGMSSSYLDVLEDSLTLASRITTLRLYTLSHQYNRINGTPVEHANPCHA